MDKKVIVHIGFPKTATSSLQKNIFSKIKEIDYAGAFATNDKAINLSRCFMLNQSNFDVEQIKLDYQNLFPSERPLLISNENLISIPTPLSVHPWTPPEVVCQRIKALFPNATIVIGIRNQFHFFQSYFPQILASSNEYIPLRKIKFSQYLDLNIKLEEEKRNNIFQGLKYLDLINLYQAYFEKVNILLFEEFIGDMKSTIQKYFIDELSLNQNVLNGLNFDKKENIRHNKLALYFDKWFIYFRRNFKSIQYLEKKMPQKYRSRIISTLKRTLSNVPFFGISTTYSIKHKEFIENYYCAQNKKLGELLKINLSKLGYPY